MLDHNMHGGQHPALLQLQNMQSHVAQLGASSGSLAGMNPQLGQVDAQAVAPGGLQSGLFGLQDGSANVGNSLSRYAATRSSARVSPSVFDTS